MTYCSDNEAPAVYRADEDYSTDEEDAVEVSSQDETDDSATTDNFVKVLAGTCDIKPLEKNSNDSLGYSTKLVSQWYQHECEYNSCPERWAEFENVDDEYTAMVGRTASVPIIHRYHYENKHWVTRSVTIQDPAMRNVLRVALAKYQDLDLDVINWTFEPPFMPLVHRWEELKAQYNNHETGPEKNAAQALLAFLAPVIAPSVLSLAETKLTGKVSFDNVWQIFPSSSIVKTKFYGVETICRVVKYRFKEKDSCSPAAWIIDMEYVDWNGEITGWTTTSLTIWKYTGFKKVTTLPVFPVEFSQEADEITARMTERGRKWAGLRGYHFKMANGTKILLETEEPQQRPVSHLPEALFKFEVSSN